MKIVNFKLITMYIYIYVYPVLVLKITASNDNCFVSGTTAIPEYISVVTVSAVVVGLVGVILAVVIVDVI